jgi:hypothetical protein
VTRRAAVLALVLAAVLAAGAARADDDAPAKAPPKRDEFGLVPDDAEDHDLVLPDPVLDRTWPGPKPGEGGKPPEKIAPGEKDDDDFEEDKLPPVEGPAPAPKPQDGDKAEEPERRPDQPLVGPDGRRDAGSPAVEPDPEQKDPLERDEFEKSDIEQEDAEPDPLQQDDEKFNKESGDPDEW